MERKLPKGWRMVGLGEIGQIITGNTPSKEQKSYYDNRYINFFKPDDISQDEVTLLSGDSNDFLSKKGAEFARIATSGAVLVTCIGTIGKIGILNQESCFNQQINAVVPNTSKIIPLYLAYAIYKRKEFLGRFTNAPVVPIINKSQFSLFEIPLPPLPTQHRIVEILEEADSLRKLRKQADEKMQDLIPALFVEMFGDPVMNPKGWNEKNIGDLCYVTKLAGFEFTKHVKYDEGGEIIVIRGINLKQGVLDLSNVKKISKDVSDALPRSKVNRGDILMTFVGSIGEVVVAPESEVFHLGPNVSKIRIEHKETNLVFLFNFLRYFATKQIEGLSKTTSMGSISMQSIRAISIPVPPLHLQQEFAARVEEIEAEKARQAESKKKLDELFDSLMQRAFAGELVV